MPRKPDQPCSQCGTLMWRGTGSLPNGQATCRPCRSASKQKPTTETWDCGHCGTTCTRPRTRGQRPRWCSTECRLKGSYQKNLCVDCGAPGVRRDSVRCGDCKTKQRLTYAQQRDTEARAARRHRAIERQAKAAQGTVSASTKAYIACVECNTKFIATWWGTSTNRTCSPQCAAQHDKHLRSIAKDRRRARKKDAYVADVYRKQVFKRDGYRCHLCNKKVKQGAVVPHPLAATLDHLVPLAAGGTHEPANCATAHFLCNSRKRHRGGGEQLALIG